MAELLDPLTAQLLGGAVTARRRRRPRRMRVRRQREARGVQLQYGRELVALMVEARKLVDEHLVEQLPRLTGQLQAARPDGSAMRVDDTAEDIDRAMNAVRGAMGTIADALFARLAERVAQRVSAWQAAELRRQMAAVHGIEVAWTEPWLADHVSLFVRDNVALIKSLPSRYFDEVEGIVKRGLRSGTNVRELTKQIQGRFDVSKSRARLIARDQVGKLHGELDKLRQKSIGITHRMWLTADDERVRDRHADLHRVVYPIDEPPASGPGGAHLHPGEDIECRCQGIPMLPEALQAERNEAA